MTDSGVRIKIVVYYAAWTALCAAAAGLAIALVHALFYSYHAGRAGLIDTLFGDAVVALALAAGQGAVALVTGSLLVQLGRALQRTVLLGLLVGTFDFVLYFVQMAIPAAELGWIPDVAVLVVATVVITLSGGAAVTTV